MLKNLSSTKLQEYWIERAKENLTTFTEYMGYDNAPFHERWYKFLQEEFSPIKGTGNLLKKFLQLWPRGHGKTTAIILYILWLIGNYPNIHIQIVSKTASQAEAICTAAMNHIEFDKKYRTLFPNIKPSNIKWTSQQFTIQRTEISKNPTVKSSGLMGPITGGRNDLVICDDIIDEENIRTHLQLEKVSIWFNKILYPTLYPWGGIIVIGTRWSYADLYSELLNKWPHSILKSIQPDNTVLWPQYWPLSKLEERRNEIGSVVFNCQYQNDPTGMEGSLLKASFLIAWNKPPPPQCEYYAGLDPSLGENDYFGIATFAYDRKHNQGYLEDVWAEHLPFPDILKEKIPQLCRQYNYRKMYMETNFWQKLLLNMPELKGLPIVPVKTIRDKTSRFISLSSHFESGRVLVNPLLLNRSEFWQEWVQYPRGQHDDAIDCVDLVVSNVVGSAHKLKAWKFG